jgi:phosphosulfolactate phosphohydrolase-like enzyme
MVDCLSKRGSFEPNDAARIAWDAYDRHGQCLASALELSEHGRKLSRMGFHADVLAAADLDRFALIPEAGGDRQAISVARIRLECGF